MSEFEFITRITKRLSRTANDRRDAGGDVVEKAQANFVDIGPGDDAAVVRAPDGRVVATSDLLIEGRHFRRDWSGPYDVGRKAAAQNLADVVAMGARPTALLIGFGVSLETEPEWAERLYDGLRDECDLVGAVVAGGDVVRAPVITLAVTALGDLAGRAPLLRSGARPGDVVAVRGRLGFAAAGVDLLSRGRDEPAALIEAHRRPRPPYDAGAEAARLGATALIDVSDGLVQDLGHVAAASGVRIDIHDAALPVAPELGADGRAFVLTGGDDHAFAGTFPQATELPETWRTIGRVAAGEGVTIDGRPHGLTGWDHFRQ
ncbi:MAG TPA: thiamine-phosphate kinase [Streptosporangiaceae bacterium]|nr:thiamine-phosphate kinase [Streptosporangiaceae bacterium]